MSGSGMSGRGSFRRAPPPAKTPDPPPIAPARVAVLKANYRQAWLYFLLVVSLIVAWGIPAQYFIARYFSFRSAATGPRDASSFVVLAYEGISLESDEISPERFQAQFEALRQAGYNPINLDDIHAFYTEGKLLPRKAALLTFDHSRKSSYFDARSLLKRSGWPAVIFLWTLPIELEDPAALRWPYVRSMLRSGAWEIGAQSHRGFEYIVADKEGNKRHFMTAPQWLDEELRYETPIAFSERLRADHEYTRQLIEQGAGRLPRAFAFPYGDFGQYDERAVLSRRINLDLVGTLYDLGFIYASSGINTRYSDSRRLNRLLVKPEWTAEDLMARLENAWPREHGLTDEISMTEPYVWLGEWGDTVLKDGALDLRATPASTGAKAWISGTDLYDSFHAHFKLRLVRGQVGFHFRATTDSEQHVYLGLGDSGDVWLRQKHLGLPAFTLASTRFIYDPDAEIEVDVEMRDSHFMVKLDGRPLFQDVISLRGEARPGIIGLSVWDPAPGAAEVTFTSVQAEPVKTSVLTWLPGSGKDSTLAAWLQEHAVGYTHFAPPWFRITARTKTEQFGWNAEFYRQLARTYSMQWTPELIPDFLETQDESLAIGLADLAASSGAHGVFCNLSELKEDATLSRITAWLQMFKRILAERNLVLIARLPSAWERESTIIAFNQTLPEVTLAFGDKAYDLLAGSPAGRGHSFARVVQATFASTGIPIAYTLTGGESTETRWTSEVRSKLLRQEGLDAFRAGRFEHAFEVWARWSELEPQNAEPQRMIGDVQLRRGRVDDAIQAYRNSLDLNPGQISVVTQTARLLDYQARKPAEANELLTLYARLFPQNTDIKLARAELLLRNKRRAEAAAIVRQVVQDNPGDLGALAMLHALLGSPQERVKNLMAILEVADRSGMEPHFIQAATANSLMRWPESWMLMPYIEERAAIELAQQIEDGPYQRLLPRKTVVTESFGLRKISKNWLAFSDAQEIDQQSLLLAATPSASEANLRLANSDTMTSGFIEATIGEARGDFWLYARRGEGSMIRFGFQQAGRMYLQIWQNGELINNLVRPWSRSQDITKLRIEIRGDAAYGFVDGESAFGSPVLIPSTMGLGWWGVSPWASQFGLAQVVIREMSGGPIPVTLAAFRSRSQDWTDSEMVAAIRDHSSELQAIAPLWYIQERDGSVRVDARGDFTDTRLMARFHRIRLLPAIRSANHRNLLIPDLLAFAAAQNVDGFTLVFASMPDEEWFAETEQALIGTGISLLAFRMRDDATAEIRELCPHVGLFAGRRAIRPYPLIDTTKALEPEVGPPEQPQFDPLDPMRPLEIRPRSDAVLYF